MLLIIDVGNTNMVFGVYNDDKLIETFRLRTDKNYTIDEIGLCIYQYLVFLKYNKEDIKDVIISSVVPCLLNTLINSIKKYFSIEPLVVGDNLKIKLNNLYNNPQQTGVDRLINAVAAVKKYGAPCIIIDMGTATTFDAVNSKGEFMGGAIYPGINTLTEILSNKTAKLPEIKLSKPINVIGESTEECMQSGIYYGYLGAIEGILLNMKLKIGDCVKVIATGGLSKHLLEKNSNIDFIDENLTLEGIKFIYESQV
jgi:type III pantothenate kinase